MRRTLCALLALAAAPATADVLDDFLRLQTGSFTTAAQAATDARYATAIWHLAEVWPGDPSGARWLYVESWMQGAPAPYIQRVSKLTAHADGTILAQRYTLPDAAKVVGAWQKPALLDGVDRKALGDVTGCDAIYYRAGKDAFEGGTLGTRCQNDYKNASYAVSQTTLTATGFTNWDRGFNSAGELVWGPAHGGYRFRRVDEQNACIKPVRMLVYGEIDDRAKFAEYARALAASGLYPANGGHYEAITPSLAVFEGEPPANRGVIIANFPCLEAAKKFWYSDEYQKNIVPLRQGISKFEVLVLPVPPLPAYVNR